MKPALTKWVLNLIPVTLAVLLILSDARPAHARACFTDLGDCWVRSALVESFWFRWAAGLDCELGFISCTRMDLIGR